MVDNNHSTPILPLSDANVVAPGISWVCNDSVSVYFDEILVRNSASLGFLPQSLQSPSILPPIPSNISTPAQEVHARFSGDSSGSFHLFSDQILYISASPSSNQLPISVFVYGGGDLRLPTNTALIGVTLYSEGIVRRTSSLALDGGASLEIGGSGKLYCTSLTLNGGSTFTTVC